MKVIKINRFLVDVFTGEGWKNWARFKIVKGHPILERGNPLQTKDYDQLSVQLRSK